MAKPTYNKTFLCRGELNNECTVITYTYDDVDKNNLPITATAEVDIAKSFEKFKGEKIILTITADTSDESFEPEEENP